MFCALCDVENDEGDDTRHEFGDVDFDDSIEAIIWGYREVPWLRINVTCEEFKKRTPSQAPISLRVLFANERYALWTLVATHSFEALLAAELPVVLLNFDNINGARTGSGGARSAGCPICAYVAVAA